MPDFMSHQYGSRYKEHHLFPVCSSEQLLLGEEHQQLLEKIRHQLRHFSDLHYQAFYGRLIERFAEFVQILPMEQGGPLGEILNIGLERALLALVFLSELGIQKSDELMAYAIFSSALLQEVGLTTTGRRLMICDKQGAFMREWLPHYAVNMCRWGHFFKIQYYGEVPVGMNFLLAPLYARRVMPPIGYAWIADHPGVLIQWLASLGQFEKHSGGLGLRLNMIESRLHENLKKRGKPLAMPISPLKAEDRPIGASFWKWLRSYLANTESSVDEQELESLLVPTDALLEYSHADEGFSKSDSDSRPHDLLHAPGREDIAATLHLAEAYLREGDIHTATHVFEALVANSEVSQREEIRGLFKHLS